jgi:hypothetical protein
VQLSGKLHGSPRAGYFKPYTVAANVDTVAVPDFDVDLLGHSYFAQAEALLYDIASLMKNDSFPGNRLRIDPLKADGQSLWRLQR